MQTLTALAACHDIDHLLKKYIHGILFMFKDEPNTIHKYGYYLVINSFQRPNYDPHYTAHHDFLQLGKPTNS